MSKINLRKQDPSSFITKIYKQDLKHMKESEHASRTRVQNIAWPSEALAQIGTMPIGECKRSLFYKILGIAPTEPMSLRGRQICDAGLMFEDYHVTKFKQMEIFQEEQLPISFTIPQTKNKIIMSGRMDVVIKVDGVKKGVEIKSVSAYKAPQVMGGQYTAPLPAENNLMQAMLYKYYLTNIDEGKALGIEEVYLMYINRSNNSVFWYEVDLDKQGWPIVTAIDSTGEELYTLRLRNVDSFETLMERTTPASNEQSRMASLRININDIFSKFDTVYDYTTNQMLPQCDYAIVYNSDEIEREFKLGRMSKVKYNKAKKGETYGDKKCEYCSFKTKCMNDSGIGLK